MEQRIARRIAAAMLLGSTAVLAAAPVWAEPPVLSFEEQAVVVAVTPGGSVAVFGVSRGWNGFTGYYLRNDEVLFDEDGDGMVRLELELPLDRVQSVWTAVDLASGELALAAPEGSELHEVPLPPEAVGPDGDRLTASAQRWAYALVVRPGLEAEAGVWGANLADGGPDDEDGLEDRSIQARLSSFVPTSAEESKPPERLAAGDVLVLVDPETLEIVATRFTG